MSKVIRWIRSIDPISFIIIFCFMILDCAALIVIVVGIRNSVPSVYDMGSGKDDSQLIIFPGNMKLLIDAGADQKTLSKLEGAMPQGDTYIDLAVISDPAIDHFGGYEYILDHFQIGAFMYNGRDALANGPDAAAWSSLVQKIKSHSIPFITLEEGDTIRCRADEIDVLSPDSAFVKSASLEDTALVLLAKAPGFHKLFSADAGANVLKKIKE